MSPALLGIPERFRTVEDVLGACAKLELSVVSKELAYGEVMTV